MLWMTGRSQETVDKTIIRPPPNDLWSLISPLPKISSEAFQKPDHNEDKIYTTYNGK